MMRAVSAVTHIDMNRVRELENLPEEVLESRIRGIRTEYGKDICLLAHLYQRRRIAQLADFSGDSFGLSQKAAAVEGGRYIVFCGVRFMAESAAILCRKDQEVIHPDPEAGCPMADMASLEEVSRAWDAIQGQYGGRVIPVTYMNSTADIKAFCGKHGGTICTSSNAVQTFEWALKEGKRIFFLPDEHLGRNTGLRFGIKEREMSVWDPEKKDGGQPESYPESKLILWRGYCPVHQKFTARDVEHVRRFYPHALVVVHPEVPKDVAELADAVGSTGFICDYVKNHTKPGDEIFIGTEINLVQNLAKDFPDRRIHKLHRSLCLTMYQITLGRILYALENLRTFERVRVDAETSHYARVALDRMLSLRA